MHEEHRRKHNEEFVRRLLSRHPELKPEVEARLQPAAAPMAEMPERALEDLREAEERPVPARDMDMVLETIVDEQRPVLFVVGDRLNTTDVAIKGIEAQELVDHMRAADEWLQHLVPLVGRIDVSNFPAEYVGTGWFVGEDIVVTNRHVASLVARHDGRKFVFNQGVGNRMISASLCTTHELDDERVDPKRNFKVAEVLYIEPESGANDIAFLKVERRVGGEVPKFIKVAPTDIDAEKLVCAVGYPARASRRVIPNQQLMDELYRGRFDIKRAAPGFTMATAEGTSRHDCTTLGGNSGSVVIDLTTKEAVGLHFAGLYQETNYAVRASVLTQYIEGKRWNEPVVIEARPAPSAPADKGVPQSPTAAADAGSVSVTVPLEITLKLGTPLAGNLTVALSQAGAAKASVDPSRAEAAARNFWSSRPEGVTGVRVGFLDEGTAIGDVPCIAVSAPASRLAAVAAAGPKTFEGFAVRYEAAGVAEQMEAMPGLEVSDTIAYDDDARTSDAFSFDTVNEPMDLLLHVGPEFSWDTLREFLSEAEGHIVSAMYEFHAMSVKDEIQKRLDDGASLTLVLDNATFAEVGNAEEEIDAEQVFSDWKEEYGDRFEHVVAPEGRRGLISDSYHIKVTVRDDDTFWLSSGNWKMKSSQPDISDEDRENSAERDLKGNREWHVIVRNKTLADRFRAHILQDFARSEFLRGGGEPESALEEMLVDVPVLEGIELERKPPSRLVEPVRIENKRKKVQLLLTPDQEGAVYSDAVVELIESARTSLLFQIPYIKTPSRPNEDRGNIDALLRALVEKLKTLPDARVILSTSGSKFSSPKHVAWYFKSKGVDVANRLRTMDKHHTKGMIVDGKRVLIGSHNWSAQGVSLNRDASLIFHDAPVARYYAQAFEVDWQRANPVNPKKFVESLEILREAVGSEPPPGFQRMTLREALHDD
jgi:phosphatidylserine/phosphatidylglycerophosphate/cardiolipin synthase-like enzyme